MSYKKVLLQSLSLCFFASATSNQGWSAEPALQHKYELALPGYKYKFPQDHFSHESYKTEWWYYTGHLESEDHHQFGYELTFFRSGIAIEDGVKSGPWQMKDAYMAHFAVSDLSGKQFFHEERTSRAGLSAAGAESSRFHVWLQNWSVSPAGPNTHQLAARSKNCSISLHLAQGKPAVLHGENGVSQKASCVGCASHYYSLTRMPTDGEISIAGRKFKVRGQSWMDHEFGSNQLAADQVGWDWFSIQLDDGSEIMLYLMRLKNGSYDPHSSGTYILKDGKSEHLKLSDYQITSSGAWTSPHTGGRYPTHFDVRIPKRNLELQIDSLLNDQELASSEKQGISYWEGACRVSGRLDGKPVAGQAYVEMTGYAKAFNSAI